MKLSGPGMQLSNTVNTFVVALLVVILELAGVYLIYVVISISCHNMLQNCSLIVLFICVY